MVGFEVLRQWLNHWRSSGDPITEIVFLMHACLKRNDEIFWILSFYLAENSDFAVFEQLITSIRLLSNNEISIPIFLSIHQHPNRSFFLLNQKCAYKIYQGSPNRSIVRYELTISWKRDRFDGSEIPRIQWYSIRNMMKNRQHIGKSLENFLCRLRKKMPTHLRTSSMSEFHQCLLNRTKSNRYFLLVFTEISLTWLI